MSSLLQKAGSELREALAASRVWAIDEGYASGVAASGDFRSEWSGLRRGWTRKRRAVAAELGVAGGGRVIPQLRSAPVRPAGGSENDDDGEGEAESRVPQPFCVRVDDEGNPLELCDFDEVTSGEARAASGEDNRTMLAVIPLFGVLVPKARYIGTGTNQFARDVQLADRSPQIHSILLHVDSPGGRVTGTPEAADAVYQVRRRGKTRVEAVVDGLMASAATWIATGASRVTINRSGDAGSIGVLLMYADISRALEECGMDITIMRTPENKARFSGVEPLTDEMREEAEADLREIYTEFRREVARNRGISPTAVEEQYGNGRVLMAKQALAAGLVDGIETVDQAIARLAVPPRGAASGELRVAREGADGSRAAREAEIEIAMAEDFEPLIDADAR